MPHNRELITLVQITDAILLRSCAITNHESQIQARQKPSTLDETRADRATHPHRDPWSVKSDAFRLLRLVSEHPEPNIHNAPNLCLGIVSIGSERVLHLTDDLVSLLLEWDCV